MTKIASIDILQQMRYPVFHLLDKGSSAVLTRVNEYVTRTFDLKDYLDMMILVSAGIDHLSQTQIGCILGVPGNAMVKRVDSLEHQGYVERTRNDHNRREYILHLTPKGGDMVSRWNAGLKRMQAKLVSPLSNQEVADLQSILMKLVGECDHESQHGNQNM